jgi:hypothetical protein
VDFDQLRQELSASIVEGPRERYHLDWPAMLQSGSFGVVKVSKYKISDYHIGLSYFERVSSSVALIGSMHSRAVASRFVLVTRCTGYSPMLVPVVHVVI